MLRGRYAPSPTGQLHLGNARTALVAWLSARSVGGQLVLRVEDLEPARTAETTVQMLADLRWLGLDWEEGPDVGGPHGPYLQSERRSRYQAAVEQLARRGLLFPCRCTRGDIRRVAAAPHGAGDDPPPYPGTCRDRPLTSALLAGIDDPRETLRLRAPAGEVCFEDRLFGRYCQDVSRQVGDFVVRRGAAQYAYQLAVVVDDAAMAIDEVVRGCDLLGSTPRQLLLYSLLTASAPRYAHVPLVLDETGARMAKRQGSLTLRGLRERGFSAETIVGHLGHSLGLLSQPVAIPATELVPYFAWSRLCRDPWQVAAPLLSS